MGALFRWKTRLQRILANIDENTYDSMSELASELEELAEEIRSSERYETDSGA